MTHLILHKVRGEPAFDIAEKIQIGDEEGWIIPTSGHRAYPFVVMDEHDASKYAGMIPADWPDHYQDSDPGTITSGVNVMAIISKNLLGKVKRRL